MAARQADRQQISALARRDLGIFCHAHKGGRELARSHGELGEEFLHSVHGVKFLLAKMISITEL